MTGRYFRAGLAAAALVLAWGGAALAGGFRHVDMGVGGHGGQDVNLIVREIRVTPVRARVGDPVRIDMTIELQGDGYGTTPIRVYANGREVDSRLYTYGAGGGGDRIAHETFTWDTKGAKPGTYSIKGEVFLWEDTSPFDNEMTVPERVTLLPAGSSEPTGGTAMERDPRYRPGPTSGETGMSERY